MQELEKILEEIENNKHIVEIFGRGVYFVPLEATKQIICKHMNDTDYPYIVEKNIEAEPPASKEFLAECREVAKKYRKNDGWIPVERELPPNAKQKGVLCPRCQIMTKYGITEGWYNPDYESWFCLFWFMDNKFTNAYIDFEHGDVPKMVKIEKGIDLVQAWRHLPEPYKPEGSDNHDGE